MDGDALGNRKGKVGMTELLSRPAEAAIRTLVPRLGIRCGVDVVDLAQFSRDVQVGGDRFLHRIYTDEEFAHCRARVERLAARFAAKEAVAKALGTGMRGIGWREIEVVSSPKGEAHIRLWGRAKERAATIGIGGWALSLTHSESMSLAMVIAQPANGIVVGARNGGDFIG